jgi:Helitron helicase-like domain at N-terminus
MGMFPISEKFYADSDGVVQMLPVSGSAIRNPLWFVPGRSDFVRKFTERFEPSLSRLEPESKPGETCTADRYCLCIACSAIRADSWQSDTEKAERDFYMPSQALPSLVLVGAASKWPRVVGEYSKYVRVARNEETRDPAQQGAVTIEARSAVYLDYRSIKQTRVPDTVFHRVSLYPNGELESNTIVLNPSSKPPRPIVHIGTPANMTRDGVARPGRPGSALNRRSTRGVSSRGRRKMRRAVQGFIEDHNATPVMITLTVADPDCSDEHFKERFNAFMTYCRKYFSSYFTHYVNVFDLQQRGVLHCHILIFKRLPTGLFRRLRANWAEKNEMGQVNIKSGFRHKKSAINYMLGYVSRETNTIEGVITRVGRNGLPYVREVWRGNAYSMSKSIRYYSKPRYVWEIPWQSDLNQRLINEFNPNKHWNDWHGGVFFLKSVETAMICMHNWCLKYWPDPYMQFIQPEVCHD